MAERVQPVSWLRISGWTVVLLLIALSFGTLAAVAWRADAFSSLGTQEWNAVRFTLWQAFLSALLSVVLAIPVARAFSRRQFWGRQALITLLGAPFILPVIVAVLGLIAVFGRNGLVSQFIGVFGFEPVQIYGLHGVVLAHVFFNLPLATRLILQGWLDIPAERFRLAQSLNFSNFDMIRHLEAPMLGRVVPGAFMVIFLICTTSFAVALALGGGPKATTIELAIYQAFKFDFDLSKAALLALLQFAICGALALVSVWVSVPGGQGAGLDRVTPRRDGSVALDVFWIGLAAAFLLIPLFMIAARGIGGLHMLPDSIWQAALRSVLVAVSSALLTVLLVVPLALLAQSMRRGKGLVEAVGYVSIAASPLVMGTGLFILTFAWIDPVSLALPVTMLVNAAMSLPFVLRAVMPGLAQIEDDYGRLADSLSMTGWARVRWLILPRLRAPMCFGAALAAALSMGDLGVIALFANPENQTLPLALYQLMGAYRMDGAFGAALLLLALSLAIFWVIDRGGRRDVDG